ncbi:MAG: hypothetical protein WC379_06875 [Methanoregula sp.]|jgi:hypothetical protein
MTGNLNRAATAGSVLMGSMGGTGAGLLPMSQECNVLVWHNVRYITVHLSVCSHVFRSPVLISPVVLYCTEEYFTGVIAIAGKYTPSIAVRNLNTRIPFFSCLSGSNTLIGAGTMTLT